MDTTRMNAMNDLRLFGHVLDSESDHPVELLEATIVGNPDLLDAIASMISSAAAELRANPEGFNHRQLSLCLDKTSSRDLVIVNPSLVSADG